MKRITAKTLKRLDELKKKALNNLFEYGDFYPEDYLSEEEAEEYRRLERTL